MEEYVVEGWGRLANLILIIGYIKPILEIIFYVLMNITLFKGIKLLNKYLDKNSK